MGGLSPTEDLPYVWGVHSSGCSDSVTLYVQRTAEPVFYQHFIFKVLIERVTTEHPDRPLSPLEENALRYVALRNMKEKVESNSLPFKEHMLDCVYHLPGDEEDECAGKELWKHH